MQSLWRSAPSPLPPPLPALECFNRGKTLLNVHFTKITGLLRGLWADGEAEGLVSIPLQCSGRGVMAAWTRPVVMEMGEKRMDAKRVTEAELAGSAEGLGVGVKEGQDSWFLLERLGDDGAGIGVRRLKADTFGRRNQELFGTW